MPVVVEPHFRENFSIASATSTYRRLLGAAPGEYVGSVSRLAAIVELLSEGVKRAFAEQGLPLPPWRRAKSVMSKWGMGPHAHGESLIFFYSHITCRAGARAAALEARPPRVSCPSRAWGSMHTVRAVFAHALSLPFTCIQMLVRRSCLNVQHGHQRTACGAVKTCTRGIADQGTEAVQKYASLRQHLKLDNSIVARSI